VNGILVYVTPFLKQLNPYYRPAMPFGNRKQNIVEDLFGSVLAQFKKYYPSGNLKLTS